MFVLCSRRLHDLVKSSTHDSDLVFDLRPDGANADLDRDVPLTVTMLPPSDLIDYLGRQANYVHQLEERMTRLHDDLARTRSQVGLIIPGHKVRRRSSGVRAYPAIIAPHFQTQLYTVPGIGA